MSNKVIKPFIRIAVLDHTDHRLYVEDVDHKTLNMCYEGKIQKYIEDNYNLGEFSWDYIADAEYFPLNEKDPIEIQFDNMWD
jgi:hypothetical protein